MMGTREKLKSGDQIDALTPAKRFHKWRPGVRKAIKRLFWRQQRAALRANLPNTEH